MYCAWQGVYKAHRRRLFEPPLLLLHILPPPKDFPLPVVKHKVGSLTLTHTLSSMVADGGRKLTSFDLEHLFRQGANFDILSKARTSVN